MINLKKRRKRFHDIGNALKRFIIPEKRITERER